MISLRLFSALLLSAGVLSALNETIFLVMGDWGGSVNPPFYQPGEAGVANLMGVFASQFPTSFVLGVGDNFYPLGICNNNTLPPYNSTCPNTTDPTTGTEYDSRFQNTFENVFSAPSLINMPFYIIAGNHDALGNVSAEIAYTALSSRWKYPSSWYKISKGNIDILMFDSTICYGIWSDPYHTALCNEQLGWLEAELITSTADYLFVSAHYPVWSACSHGNTDFMIEYLLPLMVTYNVTAFISGHDHCAEFLAPNPVSQNNSDLVFVISGNGDGCCYTESNIPSVPSGSLKYIMSSGYNPTKEIGGFASIEIRQNASSSYCIVNYFGVTNLTPLYRSPILLPRVNGNAPDYAAAGLQRPYESPPAGNYVPPLGELIPGREVNIWLYTSSADNNTWAAWYNDLSTHRANVTGVAPCSYFMSSDGSFTTQYANESSAALGAYWTKKMKTDLGLTVRPLLAASGSGMNLAIKNETLAEQFILATVKEALAMNFSGYNIQLEEPGSPDIQLEWISFLERWLDAFAVNGNMSISIIIGGVCRARDWMYMDCGNYRLIAQNATKPRPNLFVIPEALYEGEPSLWKTYLADTAKGLEELLVMGLEYKPPMTNPGNNCMIYALSKGVSSFYAWVNTPGVTNQGVWDAFGYWLTTPAPLPVNDHIDL
jgi:tartrate-resistant acid phosphatase type 5